MSRYDVQNSEGQHPSGQQDDVLSNRLGLTCRQDIEDAETQLLFDLYEAVLEQKWRSLSFADITRWHYTWLGNLYEWAGNFRTVNLSKGGFHFASAYRIPQLTEQFAASYLDKFDTLPEMSDEAVVEYLAESHVEFILIHPFREGNGRLSRLLLNVMAMRAGFQPLDYQLWEEHKEFYFKAIQAGAAGDYRHIGRLVGDVLLTR